MIDLSQEIEKALQEYGQEIKEKLSEETEKVTKETVKNLKNTSPKKKGKYAKSWNSEVEKSEVGMSRATIYNKKHYRLTHLLEFGHLTRNGRRTTAYPHIENAEQKAIEDFERGVENAIKGQ